MRSVSIKDVAARAGVPHGVVATVCGTVAS